MLLGCIGDDFTGSSDLANTLGKQGMHTVQYTGVPDSNAAPEVEAGVIALKSRSIPVEEAVGKLKAALEARIDPIMSIIARTNAGQLTTEETIARVKAYQAVGVDGICMVGIRDFAHLEEISQHISIPIMLVAYDNPELRDRERLAANGVRIVVNGHAAYFAAIKATYDCLREQRGIAEGTLNASELSTRYSTLEENRVWANKYMDVQE